MFLILPQGIVLFGGRFLDLMKARGFRMRTFYFREFDSGLNRTSPPSALAGTFPPGKDLMGNPDPDPPAGKDLSSGPTTGMDLIRCAFFEHSFRVGPLGSLWVLSF